MPEAQVNRFLVIVSPKSTYDVPPKFVKGFAPDFPETEAYKRQWGYANIEFAIRTDPGRVKVCWQVTGVRKDAWAEANRIPVEETKPKSERGRYLHPELFGKKARSIHPVPAPRVPDAIPEKLRGRAEKTLSVLTGGGGAGKDLRALLGQAKRSFSEQAAAERSRFDQQWRAVQESLEAMPAVRPPAPKRKR